MPIRPSVAHSYKHLILLQRFPAILNINLNINQSILLVFCTFTPFSFLTHVSVIILMPSIGDERD
jgi:hypothetical protein